MKIQRVYCPRCDAWFEWFDADVAPDDIGTLVGGLLGSMAAPTLASNVGIALVSGFPTLLGLALGGALGRLAGQTVRPDGSPCPCCDSETHGQRHASASRPDAETASEGWRCQAEGFSSGLR
ncbi:hypothetical protein VB780_10385 [Leptolyngbya sp. CCNP1308]|uniref:hypothetical protein n=1 Tax=Leptolyngbya sp. CCNP1308 TaxID=3110255 RepID=UPI002B1F45B6|nr:hypothetical protein [Leptolyngbya sp. CCNP1308]MEA5448977.1 hypothetical protein [Leptolyngbya sp. CCNP1308]